MTIAGKCARAIALSMLMLGRLGGPSLADTYALTAVPAVEPPPLNDSLDGPAWHAGSHATLEHELTYHKGIEGDSTDVYVLADANYLYVGFVCKQREPLTVTQHTNDVGEGSDDSVGVTLWPGGANGFRYTFSSNPIGTHYQSSSENTAFSPAWDSFGRMLPNGYQVVMRIPRRLLHGDGRSDWGLQFERIVLRTNLDLVWAYDPAMSYALESLFYGTLSGVGRLGAAAKAQPRFGFYGLAQSASPVYGGFTSRAGLDFSVPIGSSTSVYGAVHPDYSEVERDQQSISPTIFRRRFQEVRPFFTQGSNFFSSTELYTPSIPTPRAGYALEGSARGFRYAAFNALGHFGRDDNAQTLGYTTPNRRWIARAQRVAVTFPGLTDQTQTGVLGYDDGKHWNVYGSYDRETGTLITDAAQGVYKSASLGWRDPVSAVSLTLQKFGAQFSPVDGYVSFNNAAGYEAFGYHSWRYSAHSRLQSVNANAYVDVSHDLTGAVDLSNHNLNANVTDRHNNGVYASSGSLYVAVPARGLVPFNQNSVGIYDDADPNKSFDLGYTFGAIYDGYAQSADLSGYLQIRRGALSVEEFRTAFKSASGARRLQRLDRLAYTYQFSKTDSLAIGVRTIRGAGPSFGPQPESKAANFSFAYAQHRPLSDLFVVYGDPNAVSTAPTFIVKLVRFVGAGKGS